MNEALFWFILTFSLPSFGGEVDVRVDTRTKDGCVRLQKVITRELQDRKMEKFTLRECPNGRVPSPVVTLEPPRVIMP